MGTKLGQTIHDHKISLEFDYGYKWIRTTAVICRIDYSGQNLLLR